MFTTTSEVELIDVMGNDMRVVEAARVSFNGKSKGEEADRKLIGYLLKHGHMSPFEQPHMTFRITAPVFVWRQLMRHRMANYNEVSARYTVVKEEFFMPAEWRMQDTKNKQSSTPSQELKTNESILQQIYKDSVEQSWQAYQTLLWWGVAREQARMVLPLSMMSTVVMTVDLRSLMNIFAQRLHPGAQQETQDVVRQMYTLVKPLFPWTLEEAERLGMYGSNHNT